MKVIFIDVHEHYRENYGHVKDELRKIGVEYDECYYLDLNDDVLNSINSKYSAIIVNDVDAVRKNIGKIKIPTIMIPHGNTVWKQFFLTGATETDYLLFPNKTALEQVKYLLPTSYKEESKNIVGYPKNDLLYDKIKQKTEIKDRFIDEYHLDRNNPIIAYLPSWYSQNVENEYPLGTIDQFFNFKFEEIPNFVIGLHGSNYDPSQPKCIKDFVNKTIELNRAYSKNDKSDLLISADIIVGDISSVLISSLVLDKPIIHIHRGSLGMYRLHNSNSFGIMNFGAVIDVKDLEKTIAEELKNDNYKIYREYWKKLLIPTFDGRDSERAAVRIKEIIQEGK